jgi:hypothetical protein
MAQHSRPLPSPRTPGLVDPVSRTPDADDRDTLTVGSPPDRSRGEYEQTHDIRSASPAMSGSWHRDERWLAVSLAALVPIILALAMPPAIKLVLLGVGGVMIVSGLAMLVMHELRVRRRAPGAP